MKRKLKWRSRLKHVMQKPSVIPLVIVRLILVFSRKKPLRTVQFALDYTCNAKCIHCSAEEMMEQKTKRNTMSLDKIKSAIDECIELGALNIALSGGEPMMYPYIYDVISHIKRRNVFSNIITNGSLLTKERVDKLHRHGLDVINLSLEGIGKDHDLFYGIPDLFEQAINNVMYAKEVGIDVMVLHVTTNESLANGDTLKLAKYLEERGIDIFLLYPSATGKWAVKTEILLTEKNHEIFKNLLKYPNIHWEGDANYYKDGCPAGIEVIYISSYGDVTPCPFIHISFGNINEKSLKEILANVRSEKDFDMLQEYCLVGYNSDFYKDYLGHIQKDDYPTPIEKIKKYHHIKTTKQ